MQIHLNTGDGAPIYLQIINQVKYLVASGRLRPNEELPPIRALAEQLVVNPNTVARAYRDLEKSGVVVKRSTTGTFVAPSPPHFAAEDLLANRVDSLLAEAKQLNVGLEEVVDLLRRRYPLLDRITEPRT
jgi:GntR family transcriptional regulator